MKISENSWHFRLYALMSQWNGIWLEEIDPINRPYDRDKFGLCEYMRMIVLWGPFAFMCNVISLIILIGAFIVMPYAATGLFGVLVILGIVTLSVLTYFVINMHSEYKTRKNPTVALNHDDTDNYYKSSDSESENVTFWILLQEYAVSLKSHICPIIEVKR